MNPRFTITGTIRTNEVILHASLEPELAHTLNALVASEPPLFDPATPPRHAEAYAALLGGARKISTHLYWSFGPLPPDDSTIRVLASGSAAADRFYATLGDRRFDGWGHEVRGRITAPWTIAFEGDQIASIVETVRRGPASAECGVTTSPHLRGRGFATAAIRAWSRHPDLTDAELFYSTTPDNVPSRRVAARLALTYQGVRYSIY
jgi:RimJ/RimL family protein N-acetyltransferase